MRFILNNHCVFERPATHVSERGDFYFGNLWLETVFEEGCAQTLLENVIDGAEVWGELLTHIARKEAQIFVSLQYGASDDDFADVFIQQLLRGDSRGKERFAAAGFTGGERQRLVFDADKIMRLSLVTSLNWRIVSLWSWGLSVGQLIDNNVINTTAAERTILFTALRATLRACLRDVPILIPFKWLGVAINITALDK